MAAVIGTETGFLDVWMWPSRLIHEMQLFFRFPASEEIIEASAIAKRVTVRPEGQTIVYSHPLFTVREHVLVPLYEAGAIILLEVESAHALDVGVRMQVEPGSSAVWQEASHQFVLSRGSARVHTGMVGSPFGRGGTAAGGNLEFVMRIDPVTGAASFIPIVIVGGAEPDSVVAVHQRLSSNAQHYWDEKVVHYRRVRGDYVGLEAPDARLGEALEWAKVNLDEHLVCNAEVGCGLVAGYSPTETPHYDFGGDAAIGTIAMSATGQFDGARQSLIFRSKNHPWFNSEKTPFWVLACYEYWLASGDDAFLRGVWPGLTRVLHVSMRSHPRADIYTASIWAAALEGMQRMARAQKDNATVVRAAELGAQVQHVINDALALRLPTVWQATAVAFGQVDDAPAEALLKEIGSAAMTADWGTRTLSRDDTLYDALSKTKGAVSLAATGLVALGHYRQHRAWAGEDLVRDVARATFDFARGRTPEALSGAFYQVLEAGSRPQSLASSMFVLPLVRGLIGWETDAPTRSAALEPHMPADWAGMTVTDLRVGRDRLDAVISREGGVYTVNVRRVTAGPAIALRVAPALPLGARVERIVVNDRDVAAHVEETAHDMHGVAEIVLARDAQIEFHYSGGMELVTPADRVDIGESSHDLKVLDFRREARDYLVVIEGGAGETYVVQLRTGLRIRAVQGADSFEQVADQITIRTTIPPGKGVMRKTLRIRH